MAAPYRHNILAAPNSSVPLRSWRDDDEEELRFNSIQAPNSRQHLHSDDHITVPYFNIRIRPRPDDDEEDKAILVEMLRNLNFDSESFATVEWAILSRLDPNTIPRRYWNRYRSAIIYREYDTAHLMALHMYTGRAQPQTNQSEAFVNFEDGLELIDEFYGDGMFTEGTEEEQKMINEEQCAEMEKVLEEGMTEVAREKPAKRLSKLLTSMSEKPNDETKSTTPPSGFASKLIQRK